ncbi:nucleotidyltransferase [Jiangella ureilytica]|uniref:nucleotidyltransferase domain-containing protein n=1 Tax=Jiangella ureilytica TaxID=2530374 RepID=UPI00193E21CA|nr:nucleotidyltransferase [Jiangella ureilytica]
MDSSFTKLDENLNLDPFVRLKAQNIHNTIRDDLTKAGLIAGSFLQGSFARKTMLKPLKDVDIVCLLPAYMWELLRGPDGPGKAMESFKAPVAERWPGVQFDIGDEPSGKALRVTLPDVDFTIDLVPAFDQEGSYVLIGDRFEGTWEPSNTRIQLKKVSDRESGHRRPVRAPGARGQGTDQERRGARVRLRHRGGVPGIRRDRTAGSGQGRNRAVPRARQGGGEGSGPGAGG